jgi:hypothetical protein
VGCLFHSQAQRDFFGSHTYQRVDKEGWFHTVRCFDIIAHRCALDREA